MSLFFGGGAKSKPQFTGLAAQTSSSSVAITIMWGQNRVAPNIIWEGDFKSHKVKKQGKGGGGKGGGQYTYSASFQLALCWGVVDSIETVWKDTSKTSPAEWSGVSYNFFGGTTPQAPWGYLTSRHPTEAIGYPGISHIDLANYDLGSSNSLGQHSFELKGPLQGTGPGDSLDADPALIVDDFLDNEAYGVGFDMANVVNLISTGAASTTGDSTFQTYCRAMGFALSPILSTQEPATTILARWGQLCNTAVLWNGYQVKFFPYGPDPVTANGVTYLPDFPIRYQLNDRHFICGKNEDPVKFDRVDPWDAYNSLSIIISNRANEYNELPVSWRDQGLVDQYKKLRKDEDLQAKEICEISMAEVVVSLIGQRKAYIRNTFKFTLPTNFSLLEPMDVVGITDRVLGYIVVLIQSVDEDDDDNLSIVADEFYAPSPTAAVGQGVTNNPKNTFVIPGPVNPPLIFEPPGGGQIWLALSGNTPSPTPPDPPGDTFAFDPILTSPSDGIVTYTGDSAGTAMGNSGNPAAASYMYLFAPVEGSYDLDTLVPGLDPGSELGGLILVRNPSTDPGVADQVTEVTGIYFNDAMPATPFVFDTSLYTGTQFYVCMFLAVANAHTVNYSVTSNPVV